MWGVAEEGYEHLTRHIVGGRVAALKTVVDGVQLVRNAAMSCCRTLAGTQCAEEGL